MNLDLFLSQYPPRVTGLIHLVRDYLFSKIRGVTEEVDLQSRILVYRIAPGMKGIVLTIIPSQKGLKLGFYRGIDLDDPNRLLGGSGKVHKYIQIVDQGQLTSDDFNQLIDSAISLAHIRVENDK